MRKIVTAEMVAAAVEHCRREGQHPSRGRVMGLLAQQEFGGCAGDPQRVGAMIREYLVAKGGGEIVATQVGEVSVQPLPPQVEAVLTLTAQRLSESMCALTDALAGELASIKTELRGNYDQAAEQLRREADRAVGAAQADEQDALNTLEDALTQRSALEDRIELLQADNSAAQAIAAERSEQLLRVEAELERTRTEAVTANARLVAERDEARRETQAAEKLHRNQETLVAMHEKRIATAQADLDGLRQQAAVSQALAEDRAGRITQLEALLAEALRNGNMNARTAMISDDEAFPAQTLTEACAEGDDQHEVKPAPPAKDDGKMEKSARSNGKNQHACTVSILDGSGAPS